MLLLQSLISGLGFGIFNFLFGAISDLGLAATYLYSIGAIAVCNGYYFVKILQSRKTKGQNSDAEKTEVQQFFSLKEMKWINVLGVILRTMLIFIALFLTILTYRQAELSGINQGVSSSLFAAGIIITSIAFYIYFHEKLSLRLILGILLIFASVVLISIDKPSKQQQEGEKVSINHNKTQRASPLYVTIYGLATAFTLSMMSFLSRLWYIRFNYHPIRLSVDAMMLFGIVLLGYFINYQVTIGYTLFQFLCGFIGSAISCIANILLTDAATRGLGGPAGALAQFQSVVHTILCAVFLSQIPTFLQIIGLVAAVLGAIVITAGDTLYKIIVKNAK